jgi:F5/8 type C domain
MLLSYRKPSTSSSVQSTGSQLFRVGDLKHPTGLAVKLRDAHDPLSLYLKGQFAPNTLQQLESYDGSSPPSDPLQRTLVEELNQVLKGFSLFDERRFAQVALTEETRRLIEHQPQGDGLIRLNRLLLEEAYPRDIAKSHTFPAVNVTDENPRTFWVAQSNKAGEWLTIDLQDEYQVKALQVNYTDYKSNIFKSDATVYTQFRMYSSIDGKNWDMIADLSREKRDRPNAYIELPKPVKARFVKYEHVYIASPNLAISDIRIFGNGKGQPPPTPANLSARRDIDPRNAFIAWTKVPGAVGYNILWGIGKNKLYQTYQVFADQGNTLELRALTIGQDYYFAIESFDENGVSKQSDVVHVK